MIRAQKRVREFVPELALFVAVFAAYLVHFAFSGYDRFYFDAQSYWRLGDQFEHDGHFSLLSYHEKYRGYSLPLANHGLSVIGSALGLGDVTTVRLFGALLAATLGVIVLPRLARALFSDAEIGWARVLALNALVFAFWRDYFQFPLSDFPTLLAAAVGIIALRRASVAGYLVAGLAFGLAANLRPAYLAAAGLVFAIALLLPLRVWNWRHRSLAGVLVVAGALVASLPQMAINHHQRDTWSPTLSGTRKITIGQLYAGLYAQRYETYVGSRDSYPRPHVFYLDPFGNDVIRKTGITEVSGYSQYLRIAQEHPLDLGASYVLHVFNGLDVQYPTPYIRDLDDRSAAASLLLYTLLFLAAVRLLALDARERLGRVWWLGIVVLVLPALSAIPGAMEPRFFLPVAVLAYMLVCFGPVTRASLDTARTSRLVGLVGLYFIVLLVLLILSAATRSKIEHQPTPGSPVAASAQT